MRMIKFRNNFEYLGTNLFAKDEEVELPEFTKRISNVLIERGVAKVQNDDLLFIKNCTVLGVEVAYGSNRMNTDRIAVQFRSALRSFGFIEERIVEIQPVVASKPSVKKSLTSEQPTDKPKRKRGRKPANKGLSGPPNDKGK